MAGPAGPAAAAGGHPIHIHPARPLYRFFATGLGASMWFFVSNTHRSVFTLGLNSEEEEKGPFNR